MGGGYLPEGRGHSGGRPLGSLACVGWLQILSVEAVQSTFRYLAAQVVLEDQRRRLAACPEGLACLQAPNQAAPIFPHRCSWRDLRQSQPNQHSDILAYNITQFFPLQALISVQSLRESYGHKRKPSFKTHLPPTMGIIRTAAAMVADNTFGPQFLDRVDFTLCFEHLMLTIVPSALLILALPIYVYSSVRKASVVGTGALLWAKLAIALALVASELAITIRWAQQDVYVSQTAIVASATACISCAALVAFLYVEHCYSIRSSGLVAVYLVATIAFDGVKARTQLNRTGLTIIGALYIASIALKVALVILGEFSKRALIRDPATRRDINPEATSGFWNRVFFVWVNKTMWTGFKSFLHLEDLPSLEAEFRSDHIHARFHSRWNKGNQAFFFS